MKKTLVIMGLVSLFTANTHAADLFGSLKKASDSVDKAQAKVAETQTTVEQTTSNASAVTSSPEQSALELVKSKLGTNATKAKVTSVLGAPVATNGETAAEVWLYDVSSVNATAAQAAQVAGALGVNAPGASKQVAVHFADDKVSTVVLAEAVAAE